MALSDNYQLHFLRGLSTNLPAQVSNGNVYITTDEHIMYVDIDDTRLRLSDIVWVQSSSQLPQSLPPEQSHALYYVETGNMLLRYNFDDANKGWTQINAYPALKDIVKSSATTYSAVTNGGQAKFTLLDANDKDVTANFKVAVTSGNTETTKVSAETTGIVVQAADTITSSAVSASYNSDAGQSVITITETTSGFNADGTAKSGTSTSAVNIAGTGLVSSVSNNTITLNARPKSITPAFGADGKFTITYKGADDKDVVSGSITPYVKVGVGGTTTQAAFVNGVAHLNGVYTKDEVDAAIAAQLKTANAMVFHGTVSPTVNLPVSAALGATYIVSEAGKIGTSSTNIIASDAKVGDMFIAYGTENTSTGLIPVVDWQYVPAGNDDIPLYSATVNASGLTLSQSLSGKTTTIGTVAVGERLVGTVSGTTLTINHDKETISNDEETLGTDVYTREITAISALTYDEYGHISGITKTTYTIPDFNLKSVAYTAAATDDVATVTETVTLVNGSSKNGSFKIGSETLTVTASGSTVTMDLKWGSF